MAHTASPAALIGLQLTAQAGDVAGSLERLESLAQALQGQPNVRGYAPEYAAAHADEILASIAQRARAQRTTPAGCARTH